MKYEKEIKKGKFTDIWESMVEQDWELVYFSEQHLVSFWKRKIKRTTTKKKVQKTKQFLQFIEKYKTIKKNGIYDESLPAKFELKAKEHSYKTILDNLDRYIKHCKFKKKEQDKTLMPATYLNRNRFLDEWNLENVTFDQKWINDMLAEQVKDDYIIETIITEKRAWEASNPHKEITTGVFQLMIDKYNKEI